MIAVWMLYCVGIGLAFVVVGHALERALHFAGRPTRWAWVIALAGSYLVPIAAWVRPEAFATFAVPIPVVAESGPSLPTSATSTNLDRPPPSAFSLADLDLPLRWGWGIASLAMVVAMVVATTRLIKLRRHWRRTALDGRQVFVSRDIGPAVVGVWRPRVVLPEWALALPAGERELMLAHEEQHVRAGDPALLAAGFVAWLVAPWHPALWWQWRRLRLAVEMDCDARVLAAGRSAPAYGELLLRVGERRSVQVRGVAAFGEPASFLESRIRRMLAHVPRWRWAGVAIAVSVALGAIVGACEAPRPADPVGVSPSNQPIVYIDGMRAGGNPLSDISPADIDRLEILKGSAASTLYGPEAAAGVIQIFTKRGRERESVEPSASVPEPNSLEQAPALLSGPDPSSPDLLRLAGIQGQVVVQAVIEATGRVRAGSVKVLASPHPALAEAAKSALSRSLFRPARAHGQAVAALTHVTYDFTTAHRSQPDDSSRR
ncbi:MAG TPA: TonB family protein [Gemmatimonadales bacterium]